LFIFLWVTTHGEAGGFLLLAELGVVGGTGRTGPAAALQPGKVTLGSFNQTSLRLKTAKMASFLSSLRLLLFSRGNVTAAVALQRPSSEGCSPACPSLAFENL